MCSGVCLVIRAKDDPIQRKWQWGEEVAVRMGSLPGWERKWQCGGMWNSLRGALVATALIGCHAWLPMAPGGLPPTARLRTPGAGTYRMKVDEGEKLVRGSGSPLWSRRTAVASAAFAPALLTAPVPSAASAGQLIKLGGDKGIAVPEMGVGAWSWGDQDTWAYGTIKGASQESVEAAFRACVSGGITFVDTAEIYGGGLSETLVGQLLAAGSPAAEREKIQVATKFYPYDPSTGATRARTAAELLPALDASLKRLQMSSVDLYQIHGPGLDADGAEIGRALAEAVKSGRAKAVGVSNFALSELVPVYRALEKQGIPLASNQIEVSLLRQIPLSSGLVDACRDLGVGVLAYSPLAMGRLTGKYDSKTNKAPGGRSFGRSPAGTLDKLLPAMREIGRNHGGKTPAQVALNWLICQGVVPIPGAKNAQQAADNAGALGWRLADDEVQALASLGYGGRTSAWQHDGT